MFYIIQAIWTFIWLFTMLSLGQTTDLATWSLKAKHLCPGLNFCKTSSLHNFSVPENKELCCAQCSCDESCWLYNDCCPDVDPQSRAPDASPIPCRYPTYMNVSFVRHMGRFRIVDRCPDDYTDEDTVYKCLQETNDTDSFLDIVMVSNKHDHDQIFRNKFCAKCNGVDQVISWELRTFFCSPHAAYIDSRGSELESSVLTACMLYSTPPNDLQLSHKSICWDSVISTCNLTRQWTTYDATLEAACQSSVYPVRVEHRDTTFQNVFCYMCNYPVNPLDKDICTKGSNNRFTVGPFSELLNLSVSDNHQVSTKHLCADYEMYDPVMRICREMHCPGHTYPYYSKCQPLFVDRIKFSVHVSLSIVFDRPLHITIVEDHLLDALQDEVSKIFKKYFNTCVHCTTLLAWPIRNEEQGSTRSSMRAQITVSSSRMCNYGVIQDCVQAFGNSPETIQLVAETMNIETTISVDVALRNPFYPQRVLRYVRKDMRENCLLKDFTITYKMAYCPHFVLNETEYKEFRHEIQRPVKDTNHQPGFIVMHNQDETCSDCGNKYFICIDTYFKNYQEKSAAICLNPAKLFIILIPWVIEIYLTI